jgi:hypothetical protein
VGRQSGQKPKKADDAGERKRKNVYHVVNPQNQEGRLAVTWFRKKWEGDLFFMGFQKAFSKLAQKSLGGEAARVLLLILGEMDYSNLVKTPQVEIARKLGIRKQNVYRAIGVLVKEKILLEEKASGNGRRQLKLNHIYAWKGKLKQLGLQPKDPEQETRIEIKTQ